jgi:hypothetical protein
MSATKAGKDGERCQATTRQCCIQVNAVLTTHCLVFAALRGGSHIQPTYTTNTARTGHQISALVQVNRQSNHCAVMEGLTTY